MDRRTFIATLTAPLALCRVGPRPAQPDRAPEWYHEFGDTIAPGPRRTVNIGDLLVDIENTAGVFVEQHGTAVVFESVSDLAPFRVFAVVDNRPDEPPRTAWAFYGAPL